MWRHSMTSPAGLAKEALSLYVCHLSVISVGFKVKRGNLQDFEQKKSKLFALCFSHTANPNSASVTLICFHFLGRDSASSRKRSHTRTVSCILD